MSAAIAWGSTAPAGPTPARPSRPRLVLVPTGEAIPAGRKAPVRLTRFGRLAITMTVVAAAAALAVVLLSGGGASAPALGDHATTVQPGQTLSEVAAEQLPGLPVRDAVAQIQLANNLASAHVHAGQTLVIPAR
jgi:hypothetical protein